MLPPRSAADRPPRHPSSGVARPAGILIALATAAAVFGVGMLILPPIEAPPPAAPPPPPAPPAPPPPPPPPPPAPVEATPDAAAAPVDAARPASDARPAAPKAEAKPAPAASPTPAPEAMPEAKPAVAHEKGADKDVARDAWRKNLPDVSTEPGKAAMLIPIKGSIEGATYHVTAKPRSVLVVLPKGESMITMPFYSVKHDGFRQLWIKKDDETGTTLRIVLGEASDPQVEIKDDFVRVTIRRPAEAPTGEAPTGEAPAAPEAAPSAPTAPRD